MEFSTGIILGLIAIFMVESSWRAIKEIRERKRLRQAAKEYVYRE